jgi:hypothetical protein
LKAESKRNKRERKIMNSVNYTLIYPSRDFPPDEFAKYLAAAKEIYDEQTGTQRDPD